MNLMSEKYQHALAYLIINSSFVADLGLFHGRMGIVLFFAHYGRAVQDKCYEDFAGDLLDEIYEEIHWDMPVNLEIAFEGSFLHLLDNHAEYPYGT